MIFAEKILLAFSRKPNTNVHSESGDAYQNDDSSLALLTNAFPDFLGSIKGKSVVDFGCGSGHQSIALARQGASRVLGIDSNPGTLAKAKRELSRIDVQVEVTFFEKLPAAAEGQFDIVISQNSMEHFPDPIAVLSEMMRALNENGRLLVTFGPPWYAPYGSHMHFFTKLPWVNIWFSEQTVMNVRSQFRDDGAKRYEDVESGLNKMSVRKFEQIVEAAGLQIMHKEYWCVKRLDFLGKIPLLRELFVNHITSVLGKRAA